MKIRFLQPTSSENPDFPFQAGQVIDVAAPSEFLLSLIDGVQAEVVSEDDTERTIEPESEQPEPKARRGRGRGGI